ncbi:hypothetical protein F4V58_08630 [Corynebacterium phocae]|nr:hypothetical protein F4V58_08630 [Corynebacterium phocae]
MRCGAGAGAGARLGAGAGAGAGAGTGACWPGLKRLKRTPKPMLLSWLSGSCAPCTCWAEAAGAAVTVPVRATEVAAKASAIFLVELMVSSFC